MRCSYADYLIHTQSYTIKEIALKCGFESASYFSRVYKKQGAIPLPASGMKNELKIFAKQKPPNIPAAFAVSHSGTRALTSFFLVSRNTHTHSES